MPSPTVSAILSGLPERVRPPALALALGVAPSTIREWVRRGLLPVPTRLGPRVLVFDREEVIAAITKRQEGAADAATTR